MAAGPLKPDPADTNGLLSARSPIGTQVANCRIFVQDIYYRESADRIEFTTVWLWNNGAYTAWLANHSDELNQPFHKQGYTIIGIQDGIGIRAQCYTYLITLVPFNGVDASNAAPWVYT